MTPSQPPAHRSLRTSMRAIVCIAVLGFAASAALATQIAGDPTKIRGKAVADPAGKGTPLNAPTARKVAPAATPKAPVKTTATPPSH